MDLAKKVGASKVYCHSEVTYEEDVTEKRVAAGLKTEDIQLKPVWGSTLFGLDELPFKLQDLPDTHGTFLDGDQDDIETMSVHGRHVHAICCMSVPTVIIFT